MERWTPERVDADPDVWVRRQWDDPGRATTPLSSLDGFRWDWYSGGIGRRGPRALLHGFVGCDRIVGWIGHSCSHGPGPHRIKVCMLQKDNPDVWDLLLERAGPAPA